MSNLTHQPEAPHDATRQRSLFARNSAALAAANAYTIATSILFVPLLTRYLGREGYGVYNQVYALVQLLAVLSHLGTHAILTRETARAKEQASLLLGQVITLQLVLTIVFSAAVGIAAWISRVPSQVWILVILCAGESVLRVLSNTALAVSRAFEKMGHELIATVVDRTIWLAGIGLVIAADLGLVAVFVIFLVAALMRLAVSFGLLLRLIPPPRLGLQRAVGRGLLRESWPIGAGQGIRQAYERVSIIQLGAAMDAAAVGLFSGAARIFQLTDTMLTSFSTALFPAMSEAASVNGRLQKLTSDGLRALLSLALPASAFFLVFSPAFLPWLLGPEFADTAPALQIMAPAVTFAAISSLFSNLLRAIGRQRIDLYCMAGSLAINIALTALLIPSLGYLAPAVATVVSHGIYTLLASIVAFPVIRHVNGRQLIAPLASTLLMVVVWYLAREMPVLLRLAAGAVVYVVAMVVMKGIDMDFCRPVIESVRRSVRTQRSKPGR